MFSVRSTRREQCRTEALRMWNVNAGADENRKLINRDRGSTRRVRNIWAARFRKTSKEKGSKREVEFHLELCLCSLNPLTRAHNLEMVTIMSMALADRKEEKRVFYSDQEEDGVERVKREQGKKSV